MVKDSPTQVERGELAAGAGQGDQNSLKNVVAVRAKGKEVPKAPSESTSEADGLFSDGQSSDSGAEGLNQPMPVKEPATAAKRVKSPETGKKKRRDAVPKKKDGEASPKVKAQPKGPQNAEVQEITRVKVPKLAKKFERRGQSPNMYGKVLGLFKKSEMNYDSEDLNSPLNKKKLAGEGKEGGLTPEGSARSAEMGPDGAPVPADSPYPNNYRSGGIRAKEATMNRKLKLMESKALLSGEKGSKKVRSNTMLMRASKKIPQMMLNKPRSDDIPSVFGYYPALISTSSVIIFVFLAELVLNKVSFNGRCVSKVLYPEQLLKKPYHVVFGYSACEYNLQQKAETIGFMGKWARDNGWPTAMVSDKVVVESSSSFDSPNYRIFNIFGGLDANYIRNYKETFRLFWSMFMHSGLLHLIFNLIAQTQILWIIEPDWGFFRTITCFLVSGFVGNLFAAVLDPSFNVLGSSGCLFGMIAGLIPYCIENWTLLSSPFYIFVFSLVITIISLSVFNNTVSIYSHVGGWVGGFLWGFATLRLSFNLRDCALKESVLLSWFFKDKLPDETRNKLRQSYHDKLVKCVRKIRIEKRERTFTQKLKKLYMYPVEYFKRGPYDILIRLVPLTILIVIITLLCCYLFVESLYSKMFPIAMGSKSTQCCFLQTNGELGFTKKVFWCFENYQTAENFCPAPIS